MKHRSKRESSAGLILMFSCTVLERLYTPPAGFAAASTAALAGSVAVSPAFATETLCCSIASSNAACSLGILSNSSTQHTPPSDSTIAPASKAYPPVLASFTTVAVNPALLTDRPLTYMPLGASPEAAFRSWLLPSPGSPTTRQWMLPRTGSSPDPRSFLRTPPKSDRSMPALTASWP